MAQNTSSSERLREAYQLFQSGQVADAEAIFQQLQTGDLAPQARTGLGLVHLQRGQHDQAEAIFRSIINGHNRIAEAHYGLGVIYGTKNPGYAMAQHEFALTINPTHAGSLARLRVLRERFSVLSEGSPVTLNDPPSANTSNTTSDTKTGIARNVRQWMEQRGSPPRIRNFHVLEFQLQRAGNVGPITVRLEGYRRQGNVKDGDRIQVATLPRSGKTLNTTSVQNLTDASPVTMAGLGFFDTAGGDMIKFLGLVVVVGLVIFIAATSR